MNLKTYTSKQRGNATRLSRDLNVDQSLISLWANGVRPIPADRCPEIEKITQGAVTCEELRPDVDWAYLRGTLPNLLNLKPTTPAV
ncbi:TPA: helix-turn-helix domain-containing protein [Yersinia enterocolitica]|nr:helix-turn-helix domain-containing protein [Yersinia enterocolitica]HDL7431938.1 helix-turn-helix domain-containing protein [Yersinia enterocolitica]HDL7475336.1 helix-turn-helix domain-containing protein [Yersinia enterocolitica]HDL8117577.1 helix-turn-helix domain-containing protein [Yersinia enterocolitica]HDL8138810.1 helix-turn-helix domain-containing protein [Yersinia enterocolitica]